MAKIVATTLIQKRKVKSGNFPALDPILIQKFASQILEIYFSDFSVIWRKSETEKNLKIFKSVISVLFHNL